MGGETGPARVASLYGHGFDAGRLALVERAGFALRPEASSYAGAQRCSFLDFARGPALELIEVEDERRYLEFVPPGMEPYCPGISLVADGGSAAALDAIERRSSELHPYRLHVGYGGGPDEDAPGWTYLNFATPPLPGTFVWFTGYDEPRPVAERRTAHPNGAQAVVGLVFDLPMRELRAFGELAGAPAEADRLRIGDLDVWPREHVPRGVEAKAFPLVAVVLEAPSLAPFAGAEPACATSFHSEPVVLVPMSTRCWDILVRASPAGGRASHP